jgi:hypothetical protein
MMIIGCDLHTRYQQIAMLETGLAVIYQDVVPTGDARLMGGA